VPLEAAPSAFSAIGLFTLGAGVAFLFLLLLIAAVVLVVHRHEVRELRVTTTQYNDLKAELTAANGRVESKMEDLRKLTLNAINNRTTLESDVATLKVDVAKLADRVAALETVGTA
jgi:Na+-transporting methylmalonyl-CoA/oxaloacetate decarboxylase gamma subunit